MFMPGADVQAVSAPGGVVRVPQPTTEMIKATPMKTNTQDDPLQSISCLPPKLVELAYDGALCPRQSPEAEQLS